MAFYGNSQPLLTSKVKNDFHRSQKLVINDGLLMEHDEKCNKKLNYVSDRLSRGSTDFRKHVLSFDAYYQDAQKTTLDKATLCKILYYLDDDTIKVCEPDYSSRILNRGCIIPRQKIKKNKSFSSKDEYYSADDLNIGESLDIFGVKYTLINCDLFTHDFLSNLGYKIHRPQPEFTFLLSQLQEKEQKKFISKKIFPKSYEVAKFLEEYPKTLRFYGAWEDVTSYGNKKYLVTLCVNIANGTFKVQENRPLNFREHDSRLLLKPTLVPKVKEKNLEYLTEKDLELGIYLNVFGHQLYLYDCDDFTKQYYYSKYKKSLMPLPKPALPRNKII
ncbi:EF-hand domain-containing protein 1-like isoform X2 [Uloborus diversus]|uniref:EF-hand domain-containing protein 1-like isoform X2 n=1 Tax=Uloborus diversus TaxID=327109 RepID=UPI00240A2530|nr:EF-hand domain-containing protein 1-like isoform X2 [Uloborus diversus]